MNAVTATRRTIRREWTAFGVLLIVSVGLMGVSGTRTAHDLQSAVNAAVTPVETFLNSLNDTAVSYWSALTQIDRLRTENERLKQENLTLQEELSRMPAISKINDDWSKITAQAAGVSYQLTAVRVIVRDISNVSQRTLVVNKGTNDGIAKGQVVIDAGGALVGRISAVSATVATVLLISDPSAVVVGKEIKTNATGTIKGSIGGQLQMQYVDAAATLTLGDPVVTAGEALSGTNDPSPYPPGLLIGTITQVSTARNEVVQSATIQPTAHLDDATFLLVIMDYKGGFGPSVGYCPGSSASPGTSVVPGTSAGPGASASPGATCIPAPSPLVHPSTNPTAKPKVTAKPKATPTPKPLPTLGY